MDENLQGWINLYKPRGLTSFSAIYKIKKKFKFKKIGHAGTLDPDAEGILPVALNKATKLIPFISSNLKTYNFSIKWGEQTTTDDSIGDLINSTNHIPSDSEIKNVLDSFLGIIQQIPPKASAVKVNGQRAYKIFREKKDFQIQPKRVFLKSILLQKSNHNISNFSIQCGKGFYVRSLARDLATKLNTFGHVNSLKRIKVGNFDEKSSILLDDLLKIGQSEVEFNWISSSIDMLDDILAYNIEDKKDLLNLSFGKSIVIRKKQLIKSPIDSDKKQIVFLSNKGKIISFGKFIGNLFKPNKVLL